MRKTLLAIGLLIMAVSGCAWLFGPSGGVNGFPSGGSESEQPVPENESLRPDLETPSEDPDDALEFEGPELEFPESSSADSSRRSYLPASLAGWKEESDAQNSGASSFSSSKASNPPPRRGYVELPPPPSP